MTVTCNVCGLELEQVLCACGFWVVCWGQRRIDRLGGGGGSNRCVPRVCKGGHLGCRAAAVRGDGLGGRWGTVFQFSVGRRFGSDRAVRGR